MVTTTAVGYRLDGACVDLDVDGLLDALAAPSADDHALAAIEDMLARWRGPAYPDLADVDDGRIEASRLEELRVRAVEETAARRLQRGETVGLVTQLTALVAAEPLRERPRALLMEVLASTGRRADALRVYDDFRRTLGSELGIEPSVSLSARHAELLGGVDDRWRPPTRLPVPGTSILGRDALVDELTELVESTRVVTLTGPGGAGKTRLLVEIGRRVRDRHPERSVVMCELATADLASCVDVIAASLAIEARPGVGLVERIASVLGDAEVVLLVDNCEHVLEPAALLVDHVVSTCPNVRVVATSRERLRVPGERVVGVPMLPVDGALSPAVQLFVERARAVAPAFDPSPGDVATIADVVARLDGLPLAIELAAARMHTHDLGEIATGLGDRFALLSSGYRTSERHGSLSAAVSWSFGLLDGQLQTRFADLAVFAAPFTAADAAAVCGVDERRITGELHQLVERSLVVRAPGGRYAMLETLRDYGTEQLVATGRVDRSRRRHAVHQVAWVERTARQLAEPDTASLLDVEAALPELRAALGWLLDHGDVELAGRIVVPLRDYAFLRLRPDVLAWAERVAAADPDDGSPIAAEVWVVAAYASWMAGDVAKSVARSGRALRIAARHGGTVSAMVATSCGSSALFEGRLDDAVRWYRRALDAVGEDRTAFLFVAATEILAFAYAGDPSADARAREVLAEIGDDRTAYAAYAWYCAGEVDLVADPVRAVERFDHALRLADATHASLVAGLAGTSKASIAARSGDPLDAAEQFRQLIVHWRRAGMWSTQWTTLRAIAGLLARTGRTRDAAVLEGSVRSTSAGHRIFGNDEVELGHMSERLRAELGDEAYESAVRAGGVLDGDAAVEHALRALTDLLATGG
jgi:predicted ATPase